MKKRKIAFLAGLLAFSLAGVATASALIVSGNASPATPPTGQMDEVLYLEWGDTNSIGQISNLTPDAPAYRVVSVKAPQKSASAPDGKFTATLSADSEVEHASIAGLTVLIYDAPYQNSGAAGAGANKIAELDPDHLSGSEVVTTARTYYIKVSISQSAYNAYIAPEASTKLAGLITFSFGANNA